LVRIRVLLVDGHEGYRTGLARAITEHRSLELVGEASDGREGLEQALLLRPDLIVLEVRLSKLGGIDVCRTLTGLDEPLGARVVLLSGERNEALMAAATEAGASAVLDKSAARGELLERLAQLGG
jgi:two-component system, NarL family, response regulator DevR